jgi:hypothetical protein
MDYAEIIDKNCRDAPVSWWPKFAFHFTDVTNATSILSSGRLRSRRNAIESGAMVNDNASKRVISITDENVTSYVRFYFRPLTPTQYHNEGYKHPDIRYDEANIPVPIFFIFKLKKLLELPHIGFSERSQAGAGADILHGIDAFRRLDFKRIYSDGPIAEEDDLKYRQAELLYPETLDVKDLISRIVCRNNIEKSTLMNMLYETRPESLKEYENRIVVSGNEKIFYKNGLYIDDLSYHDGVLNIVIADTFSKIDYVRRNDNGMKLSPVKLIVHIEWLDSVKRSIRSARGKVDIDYLNSPSVTWKLSLPPDAETIMAELWFDESKVCQIIQPLNDIELL